MSWLKVTRNCALRINIQQVTGLIWKDMMSALHWICALTLALVCCLSAQPVRRDSNELVTMVSRFNETLIKETVCDVSPLHSPTNVDEDCLHSALQCVMDELEVLRTECQFKPEELIYEDYVNLNTTLRAEHKKIPPSSSSNTSCQCENYKTGDVKQFMSAIEGLVQQLNAVIN